jgi:hypothetical protein
MIAPSCILAVSGTAAAANTTKPNQVAVTH